MKRCHILLSVIVLLLASCNKEDSHELCPPAEIAVTDASVFSTKGYVTGTSMMEVGDVPRDLYLSAYDRTKGQNYFVAATYKMDGTSMTWRNHKSGAVAPIYWPTGSRLDFLLYSVRSASPNTVWDETDCASRIEMDVTEESLQDDILYSAAYDLSSSSSNLNLSFFHAQAWIEFVVEHSGTSASDLKITGITVLNVKQSGHLSIVNNFGNAVASWNLSSVEAMDCILHPDGDGTVTPESPQHLSVLLPQQRRTAVRVTYQSSGETVSKDFELENSKTWLSGNHYLYRFTLLSNELTLESFDISVVPWDYITVPLADIIFNPS